ncbi:N-acyl-D-glucosamine 2-epimerase [Opitutaceae bacterium TAV1]|nr:N-acyl-D-glucosamine 2-epimerase [Opitutaceae bacterium TAV1]
MDATLSRIWDQNRRALLEDTLPFWLRHGIDREHGGYRFYLDRDGSAYGDDKPVWLHGRFVWLLATLYADIEARPEWLELARHGADFLRRHAFDTDGRMFFLLDRTGRPLRKRRYFFSEVFAAMAFSALARVTGDPQDLADAARLVATLETCLVDPDTSSPKFPPKWEPGTRPSQGLAGSMAVLRAAQEFRKVDTTGLADRLATGCVNRIRDHFVKEEFEAVLETVGPDGEFIDTPEGRLLCPGHAIEAGWFILEEAVRRRPHDAGLVRLGSKIIDWSWHRGWDNEYGGLLYFRDVLGKPCTEYWHDMKFWWPHNEAAIATLMAWRLTGEAHHLERFHQVYDWAMAHFPDPEYGEWFGYLHRDGRLSTPVKGGCWKGAFHLPRMQLYLGWFIDRLVTPDAAQQEAVS